MDKKVLEVVNMKYLPFDGDVMDSYKQTKNLHILQTLSKKAIQMVLSTLKVGQLLLFLYCMENKTLFKALNVFLIFSLIEYSCTLNVFVVLYAVF